MSKAIFASQFCSWQRSKREADLQFYDMPLCESVSLDKNEATNHMLFGSVHVLFCMTPHWNYE